MTLRITRVILFARDVPALLSFYRDVLGLRLRAQEEGWAEFDAGGCRLALHRGRPMKAAKIVFGSRSVARDRAGLLRRGARMGPVRIFGRLRFSDGRDPEGNVFQISNRT
jgi:catechol 2,3-dioxygenase-like lactoylglutathione lyase family enzyme